MNWKGKMINALDDTNAENVRKAELGGERKKQCGKGGYVAETGEHQTEGQGNRRRGVIVIVTLCATSRTVCPHWPLP